MADHAGMPSEVVHPAPVWRDRADFVIGATLPEGASEQLWARQVESVRFEICCIPFFIYDLSLGDVVETDAGYQVLRLVKPSGRFVFRVWFGDSFHPREPSLAELEELGALLEQSSDNLFAVDAENEEAAQEIANYLAAREALGELKFETGRS